MYNVEFYEDDKGNSDIREFLDSLLEASENNKDARIQYKQIARYIELLQKNGTNLPKEITKHIEGDIWELRPGNNRVFYFYFTDNTYVLLHHFRKKSQKTPRREIDKAISEMNNHIKQKEGK